jgi:hypothetical protein
MFIGRERGPDGLPRGALTDEHEHEHEYEYEYEYD